MKCLLLANPTSGGGKGLRVMNQVTKHLSSLGVQFQDISGTSYESAAVNLREAVAMLEAGVVIVVGGDGMVHLAIQELAQKDVALLLIPAGTGNDFARSLGLPLNDPLAVLNQGLNDRASRIDLGKVNNRYFAEILSTGFDSLVSERANRIRMKSKRKYDLAMLLELPLFKPLAYEIELDDRRIETEAMLIAIANGASYGGGMKVCPDASLTDGLFDLMILEPVSKFELLRVFPRVFKGTHITHPRVRIERARSVTVKAPAIAYADGERIGSLPIHASIERDALLTWTMR
ncbi:MAG: YegS/Rv2252/BmrU family lipid kinase [Actinobacteria bacterium]|nr:YegS/Rv2252/BmrU family lipid kinase [Actinomycetota bacterium]